MNSYQKNFQIGENDNMAFILLILVCILIVGVTTAIGLKFGLDWQRDRANSWGKKHMEDLGVIEEKHDDW